MSTGLAVVVAVFLALSAPLAHARVTAFEIDPARSQSPTFGGLSFGAVGQYAKLRGTVRGELDPNDPHNAIITDLTRAPRNAAGKVAYSMDVLILKPIDLARGNQRVLLDFNNRVSCGWVGSTRSSSPTIPPPLPMPGTGS